MPKGTNAQWHLAIGFRIRAYFMFQQPIIGFLSQLVKSDTNCQTRRATAANLEALFIDLQGKTFKVFQFNYITDKYLGN